VEARTHLLRKSLWQHTPDGVAVARRHHILGTVEFALGQVEEAREHFERGIQSARTGRDPILEARCVAGLAEAGWQHGPESHRSEAIAVIETLIRDHGGRSDIGEEMGGLAYQLGSALVRSGEHKRAAAVLARGLEAATSDYWRMRIANALGAANYYVGRFDAALENIEMSWRLAEHIGADSFKSRILANRAGLYYGLGRPRDAVDQNKLAALWARRTGATFDYLSACAGASINLTYLARYEEAITYATNVRTVADRLGDLDEIGKGFELEALAKYHIGDNAASEELVRTALAALEGAGYLSVRPRLEWLLARVLNVQGRVREAVGYLERADAELKRTQDWEDLPGVQIELHFVHSQLGDPVKHLLAIRELAGEGRGGTPLLVFLNGALSVAEVLVRRDVQHREWMDFLSTALERAEDAAIREVAWRLCGALTTFQIRDGNKKEAHARLRRGGQLLREIADELSTAHRELYLSTRHAQSLLGAMRVE
jgi:tetratricopeptide (TPR) repeat protein